MTDESTEPSVSSASGRPANKGTGRPPAPTRGDAGNAASNAAAQLASGSAGCKERLDHTVPQTASSPPGRIADAAASSPADSGKAQGAGSPLRWKMLYGTQASVGAGLAPALLLITLSVVVVLAVVVASYAVAAHPSPQNLLTKTPQQLYLYATSRKPIFVDPLIANDASDWTTRLKSDESCTFTGRGLEIANASPYTYIPFCFARAISFSDFAFQVEMTALRADQGYVVGLVFRFHSPGNKGTFYLFTIEALGTNATYELRSSSSTGGTVLLDSSTEALNAELNQSNLLTVIAFGNDIYIYINKQFLGHATSSTSHDGTIGMFAGGQFGQVDVVFKNATVWGL